MKTHCIVMVMLVCVLWFGSCCWAEELQMERGIAARYAGDVGIEKDPSVIFTSGFEHGFEGWTNFNSSVSEIITNSDGAHSGLKFAQTTATKDVDTGGDISFKIKPGVNQVYLRFYFRFLSDTMAPAHFVKLLAMAPRTWPNAGCRPSGDKGFWTGLEITKEWTFLFYSYWHEMQSWQNIDGTPNNPPDGDGTSFYGNKFRPGDQTPFQRGQWVCVEAMLKANTIGKYDGEQAFWINGRKIGHWRTGEPIGTRFRGSFNTYGNFNKNPQPFEGYKWRTDSELLINEIILRWYVTGNWPAESNKNIVQWDDVVIATEYIGPREDMPLRKEVDGNIAGSD